MYIPVRRARVRLSDTPRIIRHVVETLFSATRNHLHASDTTVTSGYILVFACIALIVATALLVGGSVQHLIAAIATVAVLGAFAIVFIHQRNEELQLPDATPQPDPFMLQELRSLRQNSRWQREIMQLATLQSIAELQQAAQGISLSITGNSAAGATLSPYQEQALYNLATVVSLRQITLEQIEWCEQQRTALATLWEIVGLTNLPGQFGLDTLRGSIERIAAALQIEWIALLAPNEVSAVAPVLVADSRPERGQTLNGTHLRIAAEAIRKGQPLIRSETNATVACLPILQSGSAPLVIVARGATDEDATQSMLFLLGNVLARRFERVPLS